MSKKRKCTFNDDFQKEFKFIKFDRLGKDGTKVYVSNVKPIFLFHMEEGATSINIYKVKNTRKLKKFLRETSTRTSLHTVMAVKAVKLQQLKLS